MDLRSDDVINIQFSSISLLQPYSATDSYLDSGGPENSAVQLQS